MAISVSNIEKLFSLWDRGQLIVILSQNRIIRNNISVGTKNKTIRGLKFLSNQRTQCYDYSEYVANIKNVNPYKKV